MATVPQVPVASASGEAFLSYYYRARYYDPQDGRFLAEDPLEFIGGDLDLYAYVWDNPTNLVDPSGRWGFGGVVGGSAGAGLGVGAVATGSAGAGVFGGKGGGDCSCPNSGQNSPVTTGGFASGGAFAGVGPHGPRYPDPPGSRSSNSGYVLGYGASVGAGLFGTNAKSVCDLSGPFKTLTIGAGVLLGGEVTIAWSGGTYYVSASVTASPLPVPSAMGSLINTNTGVKPFSGSHCGCK
jgi:RHS repeat-associated protein